MAETWQLLSCIVWSSPDLGSSSLALVLHTRASSNLFAQEMAMNISLKSRNRKRCLVVGLWNVRTLVDSSGDERICRKICVEKSIQSENSGSVDRKLDIVVRQLKGYKVSIVRIQELKWFGCDVWPAGGYTFLHSGQPLPNDDERASRNEGVRIALDEKAALAWKNA